MEQDQGDSNVAAFALFDLLDISDNPLSVLLAAFDDANSHVRSAAAQAIDVSSKLDNFPNQNTRVIQNAAVIFPKILQRIQQEPLDHVRAATLRALPEYLYTAMSPETDNSARDRRRQQAFSVLAPYVRADIDQDMGLALASCLSAVRTEAA